jgi:hypothetical protein
MRKAITTAALLLLCAAASAADQVKSTKSAIRGTGAYGAAGCGLGSMAFGAQEGAVQILAATTNGLFGTQTFGITTGTSNCGSGAMALDGTKIFIEGNKEALAKDIARGSGETVLTLSYVAQCKDAGAVATALQQSFAVIFPAADAPTPAVRDTIIHLLRSDASLGCRLG